MTNPYHQRREVGLWRVPAYTRLEKCGRRYMALCNAGMKFRIAWCHNADHNFDSKRMSGLIIPQICSLRTPIGDSGALWGSKLKEEFFFFFFNVHARCYYPRVRWPWSKATETCHLLKKARWNTGMSMTGTKKRQHENRNSQHGWWKITGTLNSKGADAINTSFAFQYMDFVRHTQVWIRWCTSIAIFARF